MRIRIKNAFFCKLYKVKGLNRGSSGIIAQEFKLGESAGRDFPCSGVISSVSSKTGVAL